jgi:hypothetical protein
MARTVRGRPFGLILVAFCLTFPLASAAGSAGAAPSVVATPMHGDPLPVHLGGPAVKPPTSSPWSTLTKTVPFTPYIAMLLLTNGTVMVQQYQSNKWWRLTPDSSGSYINGSWSTMPAMPSGYAPTYDASAVLPNGEVIVEGGEYNGTSTTDAETNMGAIFNPTADNGVGTWTPVNPPAGWSQIGDSPAVVLPDGQFMLGDNDSKDDAFFDPANLTWRTTDGPGKADGNAEEGWSLLPDGQVLTVDTDDGSNTEVYTPSTGEWTSAGSTPAPLATRPGCNCVDEMGPEMTLPNGMVLATGASGNNAYYTDSTGKWSAAPSFPSPNGTQYDISDGPGAVLTDGNTLVAASPGPDQNKTPQHFYLFDGSSPLTQVPDAPNDATTISYETSMLVLPTGGILVDSDGTLYIYGSPYDPNSSWLPTIINAPATVAPGGTYTITGTQMCGLSLGAAYGDDFQDSTDYPLVRISTPNGIFYAQTSSRSFSGGTISVAPGARSSWRFRVPSNISTGASTLEVVANGINSNPINVTVS